MKKSPKAHKKMLTWFFFFRPQHGQVDRDVDHNGSFAVMTSSTRGRINAWLPLYINATNWHYARRFEYTYLLTMTSLVGWLVGCLFRRGIPSNNNISSYTPFVFLSHETLNPFLSGGLFNVKFFLLPFQIRPFCVFHHRHSSQRSLPSSACAAGNMSALTTSHHLKGVKEGAAFSFKWSKREKCFCVHLLTIYACLQAPHAIYFIHCKNWLCGFLTRGSLGVRQAALPMRVEVRRWLSALQWYVFFTS